MGSEEILDIDGSMGEGGGQVLRSALSLSTLTGRPIHISNIRAARSKPGLSAQHLKAVDAVSAISRAEVVGSFLGSTNLFFRPGTVHSGRYKFEIGTAGSVSLVLQTLFLPLSQANASSSVMITGGTHVPWSPSFHFVQLQWLPLLVKIGYNAQITLDEAGFYPQGRGRVSAVIRPSDKILPLMLTERGKLLRINGICAVSNLKAEIAERQKRQMLGRLLKSSLISPDTVIQVKAVELPSQVKGAFSFLQAQFEKGSCGYTALGELGKPAERVADEAIDSFLSFAESGAAIDQYSADQLLLPLSLADGYSELHTNQITQHLLTNAEIIRLFLPVKISISGVLSKPGIICIEPL